MASLSQTIRDARNLAQRYAQGHPVDASGLRAIHHAMEDQAQEIMALRDKLGARSADEQLRDLVRELSAENENLKRPR